MSTQELDRSVLDAKDREELHAIAGAMGVKAPTRMRKGELIDAILGAADGGGNGDQPADTSTGDGDGARPRTVRSARASELARESVAALGAEEEALPSCDETATEPCAPTPPSRAGDVDVARSTPP